MTQSVRLPSAARLFVMQGGDTPNVNAHMVAASQAYAVDLVVVAGQAGRELARDRGTTIEDFYSWDTPVLSPVAGKIVATMDSLPDNPIGTKDPTRPAGNHVIIQQGDRYYYLAHMRQHTIVVHPADTVAAGAPLGRCGNSGNSDYPHIHLHATHSPRFGEGVGLNLTFGPMDVDLAGKTFEHVEWPLLRGLWVHQS